MAVDGTAFGRQFVAEDDDEGAPGASFFEDDVEDSAEGAEVADPLSTEGDGWPEDADEADTEVVAEGSEQEAESSSDVGTEESADEEPAPTPATIAGTQYQTPEALAEGYRNLRAEFTRQTQERVEERTAMEARLQEQDQLIQGMFGVLAQSMRETDPEMAQQIDQFQNQLQSQRQMEEQARAIAEKEVAPLREQVVQQQVRQQAEKAVAEFYARHTEVVPRSPQDQQIAMTMAGLINRGIPADVTNPEHLEAAYQASIDPEFGMQVVMNPQLFQTPGAIYQAVQSRQKTTAPAPDAAGTPAERKPVRRRVEAQVETGSGTPVPAAPGAKPDDGLGNDEFAEAARAYLQPSSRSVLFGSRR